MRLALAMTPERPPIKLVLALLVRFPPAYWPFLARASEKYIEFLTPPILFLTPTRRHLSLFTFSLLFILLFSLRIHHWLFRYLGVVSSVLSPTLELNCISFLSLLILTRFLSRAVVRFLHSEVSINACSKRNASLLRPFTLELIF